MRNDNKNNMMWIFNMRPQTIHRANMSLICTNFHFYLVVAPLTQSIHNSLYFPLKKKRQDRIILFSIIKMYYNSHKIYACMCGGSIWNTYTRNILLLLFIKNKTAVKTYCYRKIIIIIIYMPLGYVTLLFEKVIMWYVF